MKRYLIVIVGAVVIIIGAWFVFYRSPASNLNNTQQPTSSLPIAGSIIPNPSTSDGGTSPSSPTISFATPSGAVVTVKDFIHNGETVPDVQNPGSYVLAGSLGYCLIDGTCPSGASTTNFSIAYDEKSHFFNIILAKEPLGSVRIEAEQFLTERLGLSEQEFCSLNYFVGTPYWVNATYNDRNLGFSFCPGATKLPQ